MSSGVASKSGSQAWVAFRIAAVLLIGSMAGMIGVLAVVSQAIDAHQAAKEHELVERRVARALQSIGEDLTTASVWDDAVDHMTGGGDMAWWDRHLGGYYEAQSKLPVTLGYDDAGKLFRVSKNGEAAGADAADPFARSARPIVDALRATAAGRDRSTVALDAVTLKPAVVKVEGTVYLMGTSTVVRHTLKGSVPASDPAVASFKRFDTIIPQIHDRLGLVDPTFSVGDAPPPKGRAAVDIRDPNGVLLGRIVWTPERPGADILRQAGPFLLALLILMLACGGALLWRVAQDIRRLRASEAALSAALDKAEAANQAKTRFLSNVSHELRTPLNGVLGMAEVIGADAITPQQRERLEILKASGRQQLRLVEELLDVVRLRDGAVMLETRPFRIDNLLQRVAHDFEGAAATRGLVLEVEAVEGEWLGDPVHIEKMLAALTDNAVRFTRTGRVTLRALAGDDLVLEVEDTGPGMTPDAVTRLFDAFTQGDESSTRAAEGLGLGLTAAHGLAVLMGGRIEVVSTPGVGSLFRAPLPLARA
ncbi:Sensory/regulatory protein RpfC [Brevundimonas sp. SH203]|uniref:sensor histidine kinase n=1 Tax=Brevundimonas sp. SH203 TaxID=345167 RepID=UPI0009CB15DF|nr:ATP-binding protein [Brevundimonas sp. SH203]GAW40641.1 Sensory/regulatory protein RpfC [Brevundimonas sp. SH203]